jgi:hypothetical protein
MIRLFWNLATHSSQESRKLLPAAQHSLMVGKALETRHHEMVPGSLQECQVQLTLVRTEGVLSPLNQLSKK